MDNCAPNVVVHLNGDSVSCFNDHELQEMARSFNRYIVSEDLCFRNVCAVKLPIPNIQTATSGELWSALDTRLNALCKTDSCWVNLPFVKLVTDTHLRRKLKKYTFKPSGTRGKYTWLSTTHIHGVLQQYETTHPDFKFLGALPCDFYKFTDVDDNIAKSHPKVGAVFNLDNNRGPGTHWVAFFIDNVNKTCEYFDSVGEPPNRCIKVFIRELLKNHIPGYVYLQNDIVHQRKNSECGVYSIHYIVQRLKGLGFYEISKMVIDDDRMNGYRQEIFRKRAKSLPRT